MLTLKEQSIPVLLLYKGVCPTVTFQILGITSFCSLFLTKGFYTLLHKAFTTEA